MVHPIPVCPHLDLTHYTGNDPVSKSGHILRYWGLGIQHILGAGGDDGEGHNSPHSTHSKYLGCFLVWAVMNKAAINICVQVLHGHKFSTHLHKYLGA